MEDDHQTVETLVRLDEPEALLKSLAKIARAKAKRANTTPRWQAWAKLAQLLETTEKKLSGSDMPKVDETAQADEPESQSQEPAASPPEAVQEASAA